MTSPSFSAHIERYPDAAAAEAAVAARLIARLAAAPDSVLGLATGRSMIGVYRHCVAAYRAGRVSFARMTSFNLDEYCDLPEGHPSSFAAYMREHLFGKVDADPARTHLPEGGADGAEAYEAAIRAAGGIDLQLLGVGRNGHIGFNEPGSPPDSRTRIVTLSPDTREANATDFPPGESVPERAVTMGLATILSARAIVLLATGAAKAEALAAALTGPVTTTLPASFLRHHSDVTVICDEDAASRLN
jgi:glucosamine-6-phosphate deaminase